MSTSVALQRKISRLPRGKPFTAESLLDCGSATGVRKTLSRMVSRGELMRAAHGVYARPKPNRWFGQTAPEPAEVAQAIAKRNGEILEEHGAEAARRFGLTTQMPTQASFYTTGRTRTVEIGKNVVRFEQVPAKYMRNAGTPAGRAAAALLFMGKENVTPEMVTHVYSRLDPTNQRRFAKQATSLPTWLRDAFYQSEFAQAPRA